MNDTNEVKIIRRSDDDNNKYSPARKREIIKTILIIFLAALLVLTFFSNTIRNKSLSEITTERATSGKLTERIRGSGLVESNQSYEVIFDDNKTIDTICVKTGQEIQKDDVLFIVSSVDSDELSAAEDALDAAKLDYEKSLLTEPVDYTAENQAIKNAREDLNQAIAKRDAAAVNDGYYSSALAQYNSDKNELAAKTITQNKLQMTVSAIDMDDYMTASPEYIGDLASLYSAYTSAESEYAAAYELYSSAVESGVDASSAKADSDTKMSRRDAAAEQYSSAKSAVRTDLVNRLSDLEWEIGGLNSSISDFEMMYGSGQGMTYEDCVADVQAKQRALEDLITALSKTQQTDKITGQISDLDIEAKKKEIEKLQEKYDKLKEKAATTEIKSKYSGVVTSINVQPGETTAAGVAAAVIDLSDEGYTVKVSVEANKANKVKKGTAAEVLNNWSGNIEAVLTDIKNDTTSGSKNRILVFSVSGDVDSGTYIDLSIPCGSANYDAIVPKSAVYQDKDGYFVLTVRSKSTPLGNRYYADRVNVDVIVSDEISSAVQGSVMQGDYVITAASKPVSPGDQVRTRDK